MRMPRSTTRGRYDVEGTLLVGEVKTVFKAGFALLGIMVVAIVSAKWADVDSLETLLGFEEISYLVMFAWLGIAGPGPISLDHLVLRSLRPRRPPSEYGA